MLEGQLERLKAAPDASFEEIHKAYVRLARRYPPQNFPERFAEIKDAYQALVLDKDFLDKLRQTLLKAHSETEWVAVLWNLGPVKEPGPLDLAAVLYREAPARILKQAIVKAAPLAAMEE
ncbi:MAG: hypothetical protein K6C33_00670 [Desulfovibrio sp.]|nr:hypothetical protein [Desulfovibrio sp.]